MYRICLVNLPFANLATPSIALTQLRAVTEARFPGRVSVEVVYLTHDFGKYLGVDIYNYVSNSLEALYAGFGDWYFRAVAFPEMPDNTETYLNRFYAYRSGQAARIADLIARTRPKLDEYIDTLIARYALDQADMVGFTSMFMQNGASFALARRLKRRNPRLITVIGGANCEFPMGRVIAQRVPDIDYVFSGPALKNFPEFVERQLDGTASGPALAGVFTKDWRSLPAGDVLGEELSIDEPVALDYDEFLSRFETYFPGGHARLSVPIETSRGCWWGQRAHCTFCGLNGATMAYRAMKPELAIGLFKSLFRYSGKVRSIKAVDNILPKNYIDQVLPFLDTPKDVEIFYEVKADLKKHELEVLANAGVKAVQPGIESLATSTLKLMRKGTSACQNISFLKNCAAVGIKPVWNLLIGFPGERAAVYRRYCEVLPRLTHLPPPNGVFPVRFDRFSPYHKEAESYSLRLRPMDFYSYVYPFDPVGLQDFAYYFDDENAAAEYVQEMAEWVEPLRSLVGAWQARWSRGVRGGPTAVLQFQSGSDVVLDSRDGTMIERPVGSLGKAMLKHAMRHMAADELIRAFSPAHGIEASRTLESLEAAGLVFREGDRVLGLVISADDEADGDVVASPEEASPEVHGSPRSERAAVVAREKERILPLRLV
jgi:ribosomal peptide maturation radical SAM protein 1